MFNVCLYIIIGKKFAYVNTFLYLCTIVSNPHKTPEIGAGATFDMMKQERDLCAHCAHREKLRKLSGVLFCDKSSTTRVHPKQHCDEYKERGTQLELFQ